MLSVSRIHVVRLAIVLSILAITLTPYLSLGVHIAFACGTGGTGSQCGGG